MKNEKWTVTIHFHFSFAMQNEINGAPLGELSGAPTDWLHNIT